MLCLGIGLCVRLAEVVGQEKVSIGTGKRSLCAIAFDGKHLGIGKPLLTQQLVGLFHQLVTVLDDAVAATPHALDFAGRSEDVTAVELTVTVTVAQQAHKLVGYQVGLVEPAAGSKTAKIAVEDVTELKEVLLVANCGLVVESSEGLLVHAT